MPVVVTGSEFPAGLALLRAVRAGGDAPIAAVTRPDALGAVSRAAHAVEVVHDPRSDPAAFVRDVGTVAVRYGAAVLPGTEPALRALAHHRDQLPGSVVAGCPSAAVVDRVLAKGALEELAAAGGLRTPPTRVLTAESADRWDGGFPAVVKPLSSHVSQADGTMEHGVVARVPDELSLPAALAALPGGRGLVQPYLVGDQRTVDGLAWDGAVVAVAQKTGDRTWPRDCGVLSYGRIVRSDPDLERRCRKMFANTGWSGLFKAAGFAPSSTTHDRCGRRGATGSAPRLCADCGPDVGPATRSSRGRIPLRPCTCVPARISLTPFRRT